MQSFASARNLVHEATAKRDALEKNECTLGFVPEGLPFVILVCGFFHLVFEKKGIFSVETLVSFSVWKSQSKHVFFDVD